MTNIYSIQRNNYIVCEDDDDTNIFDEIIERIWLVILEIRMMYVFNDKWNPKVNSCYNKLG